MCCNNVGCAYMALLICMQCACKCFVYKGLHVFEWVYMAVCARHKSITARPLMRVTLNYQGGCCFIVA